MTTSPPSGNAFQIGDAVTFNRTDYKILAAPAYELLWEAGCRDCGSRFQFKTNRASWRTRLRVRCNDCSRPQPDQPPLISVGDVIERSGQIYTCVAIQPYTRTNGLPSEVALMASECETCGQSFHDIASRSLNYFKPHTSCELHRSHRKPHWPSPGGTRLFSGLTS